MCWFVCVIEGSTNPVVNLADNATSWVPGDRVVVASSDYDSNHAEEFTLAGCSSCTANQVQLTGLRFLKLNQVKWEWSGSYVIGLDRL